MKLSTEIVDRRDFGFLCNSRRYMEAVEVGVDRGDFAWHFLRSWRGNSLRLVDNYEPYDEMPWDRTPDIIHAVSRLAEFGDRARFMRTTSRQAAEKWVTPLQFCYIDAVHSYESAREDISLWYPKIDAGGMLAGHDYCDYHPGVMQAVNEHAEKFKLTVYVTSDGWLNPSWYVYKP